MTKIAILAAACLALAACNSPAPAEPVDAVPAAPAPGDVSPIGANVDIPASAAANITAISNAPAFRATELGRLNGCSIYRVQVDGRDYVLAASSYTVSSSNAGFAARACSLEAVR
jgi:hypothetical protein